MPISLEFYFFVPKPRLWRKFDPIVHSFNRDLYASVQLDVFSLLCRPSLA